MKSPTISWLSLGLLTTIGCANDPSRDHNSSSGTDRVVNTAVWARIIDRCVATSKAYEFDFPLQSTEDGGGMLYTFVDSSSRMDIDRSGETGRSSERFYSHGVDLRLAVSTEEHYDRPLSGRVIRRIADSTWFEGDSVIAWINSIRVADAPKDSFVVHGKEVRAEYLWANHMAGTMPSNPGHTPKPYNERCN
jgi:hypothetical protein